MKFTHLKEKKLSYCDHFQHAMWIVFKLSVCIPKTMIHAFYPDVLETSTTDTCKEILEETYPGSRFILPEEKKPF